jgi:hypothetical protein
MADYFKPMIWTHYFYQGHLFTRAVEGPPPAPGSIRWHGEVTYRVLDVIQLFGHIYQADLEKLDPRTHIYDSAGKVACLGDLIHFYYNPHLRTLETTIFDFVRPIEWDPSRKEWVVVLHSSRGDAQRLRLTDMAGRFTVVDPDTPVGDGAAGVEREVTGEQIELFGGGE